MARRARLDAELVRRKLARSREQAAQLVAAGRVQVRGTVAHKVAAMVDPADPLLVTGEDPQTEYVSRGGHKLAGALAAFGAKGLTVEGRRCLDAGASTGGFTDVLLRAGADRVVAVDVGYGQLAWPIRTNERVDVHERTNVRTLTPDVIGGPVDLTVADLSFISLRLVLPALAACTGPEGDLALMVKPQFEVGKERVGTGGVVRDWRLRAEAVLDVAAAAATLGLGVVDVTASPLPGPSGNVEFFVWFRRGAPVADRERVEAVVEAGPSGEAAAAALSGPDGEAAAADAAAPPGGDGAAVPAGQGEQERPGLAEARDDQPVAHMEDK
ncbi:TlyA family rRNA (cytidine-2'-O)-methyltransferase [Actinoplanes sp. L3-i22]|nr:TlyA family RNA methyltransferase [Actinoplanes sp. L3-i22]BCY13530.1 TlyA family rRNA (cytidine-2'-O)-methyltransferase [Actinoplanes sp. L3-i22]